MITRESMMEPMLAATPAFRPAWEAFVDDWRDHDVPPPIYLALAELARHLAALLRAGDEQALRAVFAVVEDWYRHGDEQVCEAATVGLLEDLQNTNVVGADAPAGLLPYLGPVARREWDKVDAFWSRGELIGDD